MPSTTKKYKKRKKCYNSSENKIAYFKDKTVINWFNQYLLFIPSEHVFVDFNKNWKIREEGTQKFH